MSSNESMAYDAAMHQYEKQYDGLKAELQTLGFIGQGSVSTRRITCGRPACRCHSDPRFPAPCCAFPGREQPETHFRGLFADLVSGACDCPLSLFARGSYGSNCWSRCPLALAVLPVFPVPCIGRPDFIFRTALVLREPGVVGVAANPGFRPGLPWSPSSLATYPSGVLSESLLADPFSRRYSDRSGGCLLVPLGGDDQHGLCRLARSFRLGR